MDLLRDPVMRVLLSKNRFVPEHIALLRDHEPRYLELVRQFLEKNISFGSISRVMVALWATGHTHMCSEILIEKRVVPMGDVFRFASLMDAPRERRHYSRAIEKMESKIADLERKLAAEDRPVAPPQAERHHGHRGGRGGRYGGPERREQHPERHRARVRSLHPPPSQPVEFDWKKKIQRQLMRSNGKLAALRAKLTEIEKDIHPASLTKSVAKLIRRFVKVALEPATLEYYLLAMPLNFWKKLADLVHFSPKDFQLSFFLPCVFGAEPPKHSIVYEGDVSRMTIERDVRNAFMRKPREWGLLYSVIRTRFNVETTFSHATKALIAKHIPLETALWFYEELSCHAVEDVLYERICVNKEPLISVQGRSNYGKLMERTLLMNKQRAKFLHGMVKYANERLQDVRVPLGGIRLAILGDASASMHVAVRVSAIICSLLHVATKADLSFFNRDFLVLPEEMLPKDAMEVINIAQRTRASGRTCPAAPLLDYYNRRERVDVFVVVSDEEENTEAKNGQLFAPLFRRYIRDVHPYAFVVLVSFLKDEVVGRMKTRLEEVGIEPLQFRLDKNRPDLSRFDALLSRLAFIVDEKKKEQERRVQEEREGGLESQLEPLKIGDAGKEEEGEEDDDMNLEGEPVGRGNSCCICVEHHRECVFLPCRHLCACEECAKMLQECPVCRQHIEDKITIYRP
eukprot:TRINITY_DN2722_c0_g1_i1.p1 TRINITY_DN2722_c0_g1~~TRINITY_DN2722_c0_g1_i1.p1  ORF type:complete len:686 (+),score=199.61 TRINITY_DN2722_c0_g1_i1:153-2210(+)